MPLGLYVFSQDNSNIKKEDLSWACRKFNGFAPIAAWLSPEIEQRPGSQHAQESIVPFRLQVIHKIRFVGSIFDCRWQPWLDPEV